MMQKRYTTHISSYVRRCGRLSRLQKKALQEVKTHKIEFNQHRLLPECFDLTQDLVLEIGFGMGDFLIRYAECVPHHNIIGIDVHLAGIARVLSMIQVKGWSHVRLVSADAVEVLRYMLPENSLSSIWVLFPDPWPKKRHQKRRFFCSYSCDLLYSRLKPGGRLMVATDDDDYAHWIRDLFRQQRGWLNLYDQQPLGYQERQLAVLGTKYEKKALLQGRSICDLLFQKPWEEAKK